MTEYQHRPNAVKGYRDLTEDEVYLVDTIKTAEIGLAQLWAKVDRFPESDSRWLAIARTHFQEGFSALVRSVARPRDPFAEAFTNNQQDEVEGVIPPKRDGGKTE